MGLEIHSPVRSLVVVEDSHPLDFVRDVVKKNPGRSRTEQFEKFRSLLETNSDTYQRAVDWYFFVNMHASLNTKIARPQDPVQRAQVRERGNELVASIKAQLIILDLVMPNGKTMRDCTGTEMAKFGNRYHRIAERVGKAKTVGSILNEDQVQEILKG